MVPSLTRRWVPVACALWSLALVMSASVPVSELHASGATNPHRDVPLFTHSEDCVACHNNLVAASGEDVSIGTSWRSTMMANSARDPYWQASVRRETLEHPSHSADIEDECAACHMPMPQRMARAAKRKGAVFSFLPFTSGKDTAVERLAADGISCTVCHQIAPDGLGLRESFNANFTIRPTLPGGTRVIYGPFAIDAGRKTIMRSVTGYEQAEAPHIRESELCASCHTLITEAFGPSGQVVGSLPEQMNYQEWQHSAFSREKRSCQSCHMPTVSGPIRVASVLGDSRDHLARHAFVGGNAHMLRILNRFRHELSVAASPAELDATATATIRQLRSDTATVAVSPPQRRGGQLTFDVDVANLTGHKFPTGYPSRRTWLHVLVTDASGRTVFESGAVNDAGLIDGNDSDETPVAFEPHYDRVTRPDQVQIYEPILGDLEGVPTTGLLRATQYLKDNRLLPRGFDKTTATKDIGVHGSALADPNFTDAGDRVRYDLPVTTPGPLVIAVELRYQSIGYRWAHNLEAYDAPEPKRFVSYYTATVPDSSVVIASAVTSWPASAPDRAR